MWLIRILIPTVSRRRRVLEIGIDFTIRTRGFAPELCSSRDRSEMDIEDTSDASRSR